MAKAAAAKPAAGSVRRAARKAVAESAKRPRAKAEPVVDVQWLTTRQLDDWMDLAATMILLPSALESQLNQDAGLAQFEYFVLAHLSESPNRECRMSELAFMTNGSLSRLSHVASRLEQRGYVTRRPSPDDGRITIATLTDEGMVKLEESAPGHVARVRDLVVDALTPEQFEAFGDACRLILERIALREGRPLPQSPRRIAREAQAARD
jgi:DNA-binding MarR family transcriptional regulator